MRIPICPILFPLTLVFLLAFSACVKDSTPVDTVNLEFAIGSFVDTRDGHEYEWVKIGGQIWMAENLAYLPSVSPPDKGSETERSYYVYGYEGFSVTEAKATDNSEVYGTLFNWAAALTSCPDGWHLPSQTEFEILCSKFSDFQKSLKSTMHWLDDGNGDNSSGFNARPAGLRIRTTYDSIDYFEFYLLGEYTSYWTDSLWENNIFKDPVAIVLRLNKWGTYGIGDSPYKNIDFGISVRCVKDE